MSVLSSSLHAFGDVLAATPSPSAGPSGGGFNDGAVRSFLITKIAPIIIIVVGLIIMSRSGKGQWSQALTTGGIAVLGVLFIVGGGALFVFGESIVNTFFG
jgi:hypothetical protein